MSSTIRSLQELAAVGVSPRECAAVAAPAPHHQYPQQLNAWLVEPLCCPTAPPGHGACWCLSSISRAR
jgi:hypothetical protein